MSSDTMHCLSRSLCTPASSSPFSDLVEFDYYDGPTSGALHSAQCSADLRFELIDWNWERRLVRIFSIALLPEGSFTKLIAALAPAGARQSLAWVSRWQFDSEERRLNVEAQIDAILDQAGPPRFIVAATDLLHDILGAKEVTAAEAPAVESATHVMRRILAMEEIDDEEEALPIDWFSFLGIDRG